MPVVMKANFQKLYYTTGKPQFLILNAFNHIKFVNIISES